MSAVGLCVRGALPATRPEAHRASSAIRRPSLSMNEHSFPPSEVYVTLPLFWITPWSKVIAMYRGSLNGFQPFCRNCTPIRGSSYVSVGSRANCSRASVTTGGRSNQLIVDDTRRPKKMKPASSEKHAPIWLRYGWYRYVG